jgi:hypothetical protein
MGIIGAVLVVSFIIMMIIILCEVDRLCTEHDKVLEDINKDNKENE